MQFGSLFIRLSVVLGLLSACKTTQDGSESLGAESPTCEKPTTVKYEEAKSKPSVASGTGVSVGLFDLVNISVKPDDFRNLDAHDCKENGTCTSVLTKPVSVNVNVPVTLLSKVSVTYEQDKGDKEGVCLREVKVGTKVSPPLCIGNILDFSINMGVSLTQTHDANTKKTTYNAKPYCNAKFNCSIPFLEASAKVDQTGMTFGSTVSGPGVIPNVLVKVDTPPQHVRNIGWPSLPAPLKRIKEYFAGKSAEGASLKSSEPDFYWEDLANPCALN